VEHVSSHSRLQPNITTNSDKKEKNYGNLGYLMFPSNQSKLSGVAMS
jgi:hypothetical protein